MLTPDPEEKAGPLSIRLLGPFEVRVNGTLLPPLRSRKVRSLLALLTLRAGTEATRSWLAGVLWPASPESTALATLRRDLTSLRRALGPAAARLRSPTPRTLCLDLEEAEADVLAFDAAGRRGDPASLQQTVAFYRGPLLEGCAEEWVFPERQEREQAYLRALERLAEHALACGDLAHAESCLRRAVATDPLRETAQRALMHTLAEGGNCAAALLAFRELRHRLHREINAAPDAETQALFHQLRAEARRPRAPTGLGGPSHAGSLAAAEERRSSAFSIAAADSGHQGRPRAFSPCDPDVRGPLGSRAADDLPLIQMGPLAGSSRRRFQPASRHNLPLPLNRFIGREREMAEAKRLLATAHLLTLTGTGGCGKTRLALQVGACVREEFPDGVWLVELASLADAALAPAAVAAVLEVREQVGRSITEALQDSLRSRSLLLILDNCEHLLTAAAELAERLLRWCPHLRVIATSREGLSIAGEQTLWVPPLSVPRTVESRGSRAESPTKADPSSTLNLPLPTLLRYEAVQLFVDRVRAVRSTFAVTAENAPAVAQICRRLDGIPLAIELAAARVKALSVEQIAARLDDRFRLLTRGDRTALPRHQTLRALIDWSHDLLSEPERILLRRLSVFAGGWTLEAAEAVCAHASDEEKGMANVGSAGPTRSIIPDAVLDLLTSLVEKSLVLYQEKDEAEWAERVHLPTANAHPPEYARGSWRGGAPDVGRYRLLETVRQYAGDRLLDAGEMRAARDSHLAFFLRLAEAGQEPDGIGGWKALEREHDNLRAALEWAAAQEEGSLALRLAGTMTRFWLGRGPVTEGRQYLERILSREDTRGPTAERARALNLAAMLAGASGDYGPEQRLHQECLTIRRTLGDQRGIAESLVNLAYAARNVGKYTWARTLVEESLAAAEETGDKGVIGYVLTYGGCVIVAQGDHALARSYLERGLAICHEFGDQARAGVAHRFLALVDRAQGELASAWAHLRQSLAVCQDTGFQRWIPNTLLSVAGLAAEQGRAERAARLFGAAEALREALEIRLSLSEQERSEPDIAIAHSELGSEAFAAAWAEGRTLELDEAVHYALEGG